MDALAHERAVKFESRLKRLEEIGNDAVSEQEPQSVAPPEIPSILVSSEPEAICPMEVREEQLRQVEIFLSNLPDEQFVWDGKPKCPMPKVIKYLYASDIDSAQAQQLLQTRFLAISDALVVNVTRKGPTKLKEELSAGLHTWWTDRTMEVYEDSPDRKHWFSRLRQLVRTSLGQVQYQCLGLLDLEKNLKKIRRQATASQEAAVTAASKRKFYDAYLELSGEQDSERLDELYPVECNASAIEALLMCLSPELILQHACTLRFICKHLGYLNRVKNQLIVDAPDMAESDLVGTYRNTE
jgi:hypothetical protein